MALALWTIAWVALDKTTLAANDLRADAGLFALGGRLWAEGLVPYRDFPVGFWDNKPPGIFAAMAGLWRATGYDPATDLADPVLATDRMRIAMALAEGTVALATVGVFAALVFGALGRAGATADREVSPDERGDATAGRLVAFAATALFALLSNCWIFTEGGGLTETWLILPDTLAALFAVGALRRPNPARPLDIPAIVLATLCGVTTATAFVFKPIALAPAAGFVTALVLRAMRGRALRPALLPTVFLLGGFVIGLAPWCVWMSMHGALRDCVFASVGYNFSYVAHGDRDLAFLARRTLAYLGARCLVASAGVAAAFGTVFVRLRRKDSPLPAPANSESVGPGGSDVREDLDAEFSLYVFALAWLAFALAGAYAGGYGYGHYFLPAMAPLVFAGALGWRSFLAKPRRARAVVACVALGATILPTGARQVVESRRTRATFSVNRAEDARTRELLREACPDLTSGDSLLVLDHHFAHYLDGGFAPAIRMLSPLHAAKSPFGAEALLRDLEGIERRANAMGGREEAIPILLERGAERCLVDPRVRAKIESLPGVVSSNGNRMQRPGEVDRTRSPLDLGSGSRHAPVRPVDPPPA